MLNFIKQSNLVLSWTIKEKYRNEIDCWVYTKRYKNVHMIDILPINILHEIFDISEELKEGYSLKEVFLDIWYNR